LRRATDKAKLGYLESTRDEITELQRTGWYDLMSRKAKELDWKENIMGFKPLASKTLKGT
jgi:hypothetical protein